MEDMTAVEWALAIVFGVIGAAIVIVIIGYLFYTYYKLALALILWLVVLGPPGLVLAFGIWFAEAVGGVLGGLLVILTLGVTIRVCWLWIPRAFTWVERFKCFRDY